MSLFNLFTNIFKLIGNIPILGDIVEAIIGPIDTGDSPTYNDPNNVKNTISEDIPIARCYGTCKIGGNKLRFNDPTDSDLRIIFSHCLGEVEGITEWKVNDIAWGDLAGAHTKTEYKGTWTQTADARFASRASAYRGMAYTAATFVKDDKQTGSNPTMTVVMEGLICLPLIGGSKAFSHNNAVIMYDWYLNVEGYSAGKLDLDAFKSLEALCDEVPSGGSIARYRFDYNFDTNQAINDSKKLLWSSFNGRVIMSQGKLKPVWDSGQMADGSGGLTAKTVSHAFDEDNIVRGSLTWRQPAEYNIVRIHYLDSTNDYKKTSIEEKDERDINENGEILYEETCFYITDSEIARRRAKFKFNKFKYTDYEATLSAFSGAGDLELYDLVSITHTLPGWTAKQFIIIGIGEDTYGRMKFVLSAYYSGIYDDAEASNQATYESDLPNPYVAPGANAGINLALASPGTGFDYDSVKVTFTPPVDPFYASTEIYVSNDDGGGAGTYYLAGTSSGEEFVIQGMGMFYVPGDTCYVKFRNVNEMGVFGSLSAAESIVITSSIRLGSFYAGLYDFWGGNAAIDNAATTIVLGNLDGTPKIALGASADTIDIDNMATHAGFFADGNGYFRGGGADKYIQWNGELKIVAGANLTIDSSIPAILMGAATDYLTGAGIFEGWSGGAWKFHFGDPANDYIGYDGAGNLHITGEFTGSTSMDGTTANTFQINSDDDDVNVQLILGRTTGGDATLQWNGTNVTLDKQTIADNTIITVDGSPSDNEYAKWTANGLEGRTYANVLVDLSGTATAAFDFNAQALTGVASLTLPNAGWIGIGAAAERLEFYTAGDAAFMGCNVGIGTTSPRAKFHVQDTANDLQMRVGEFQSAGAGIAPYIRFQARNTADDASVYADLGFNPDTQNVFFRNPHNSAERFVIDESGNVGIGTTSPDYKLEIETGSVNIKGHDGAATGLMLNTVLVTTTAAEINLNDGSVAGTIVNSKSVIYGSNGEVNATTFEIAGNLLNITTDGTDTTIVGTLLLSTCINAAADVDKFLVLDAYNNVDYRTGTNVLADLSGDAGAAFSWNNQNLTSVGDIGAGTNELTIGSINRAAGTLTIEIGGTSQLDITNANMTIKPGGDIVFNPTGNDVYPSNNYDINLGLINKKFLTLHAAELWVETLVAQDTLATIGGRILVGPTTILTSDLGSGAGDTTITVEHNNLASGDTVVLQANGKLEFMLVTGAPGGAGPYTNTVTRDRDGTGRNLWYAGDAVFNTGAADDGFIDLYSLAGVVAGSTAGPTIVGNIRNSDTYNDFTEAWAIGNLNGLYGYGANTYGAAFGKYSEADYLTIDATNGIRFVDSGDVVRAQLTSGTWTLGYTTNEHVSISATAVQIKNGATVYTDLTNGILILGDSSNEHTLINTSGVALKDGANVYALFAATTTIGLTAGEHVSISPTAVQIKNAGTVYTDLTNAILTLGDSSNEHVLVNTSGVSLKDGASIYGVFAATTTLGPTVTEHVEITSAHVQFKDGASVYTDLAAGILTLGLQSGGEYVTIASTGLQMFGNDTQKVEIASDGTGWLAGDGKLNWDAAGNITMTGSITLTNQISSGDISDVGANADQTSTHQSATVAALTGLDADNLAESATKKWAGETGATTDQTGAEIKTAYQAEANAYTDTKNTKLAGVATGADVTGDNSQAVAWLTDAGALATKNAVDLATAEVANKVLDNIADGATYSRVLTTDITSGHILLSAASGSLDNIDNGATYGRVNLTAISAGNILLSTCSGDLDDIANGTYGKVLTTAISAGKIVLSSAGVSGSLPTSLSDAKCTDANADQTSAHTAADAAAYTGASIATANTDAKCTNALADQTSANTAKDIAGQGALATKGSVDLATGEVTNKSLANVDSAASTKLGTIATNADVTADNETFSSEGDMELDDIAGTTKATVLQTVLDAGYVKLLRLSADANEQLIITASGVEGYANSVKNFELASGIAYLGDQANEHIKLSSSGLQVYDGATLYATYGATTTLGLVASEHISISSTAIQLKDDDTVLTDISGGNVLIGQTGANQSNVYITSGAISLRNNVTDIITLSNAGVVGITVLDGGDITLEAGGDIAFGLSDASPSLLKWGAIHNMGAATTTARGLCIWPETANQDWFYIGFDPVANAMQKYNDIIFYAYDIIHIESQYDATHYSKVITDAGATGNKAYLQANHGGTIVSLDCDADNNEVVVSAADFKPLNDNTTDIGELNKAFKDAHFKGHATISGAAPATPVANSLYKDNIIKGWIQFNGTGTIAINDDFNVTSITDNGVGNYTVTWDTDFANDDYTVAGNVHQPTGSNVFMGIEAMAVGSIQIHTRVQTAAMVDSDIITLIAIGDQA